MVDQQVDQQVDQVDQERLEARLAAKEREWRELQAMRTGRLEGSLRDAQEQLCSLRCCLFVCGPMLSLRCCLFVDPCSP